MRTRDDESPVRRERDGFDRTSVPPQGFTKRLPRRYIPQLDGFIRRTSHDASPIRRE
jgi:hypothetical protein